MNILFITPYYAPDLGPNAPLNTSLSQCLVQRGHRVTVTTMVPHYPSGRVLPAYQGRLIQRTLEDGVDVVRIAIPSMDRSDLTKRMVQFICYQIGATLAGLNQKFDAAIISNPFLCSLLPFTWQTVLRHKPTVYFVDDVYPDVGIKLGVFKHKLVISTVTNLERFCLTHSSIVQIISDSFRPSLCAIGVPDSKIALVKLWVDTNYIHPLPKKNLFSKEYGLTNHYIVLYAGNIGLSQGLEQILSSAKLLASQEDIRFVLVGDGKGLEILQSQAKEDNLTNVKFIPYQPRERLSEVLACADVSLVILRRGIGMDSLPSKTFSIMASGRPILVSVDEESETWKLVEGAKAGMWVSPEDPSKLAQAILALKQDRALGEKLGQNGRNWVLQHHSPQTAAEQFENLLAKSIAFQNS